MTNPPSFFSLNGQAITDSVPSRLLGDRGLAYGHGVFESILLHDSKLALIKRHLARLEKGASLLNIPVEFELVIEYLNLFLDQLKARSITQGVVKVIVTAGQGGRGYQSPEMIEPCIICSYFGLPKGTKEFRNIPINVLCCEYRLPINQSLAGIKHLNRLDQVLARSEWSDNSYAEGLMFTESDHLIEAVSANVFVKTAAGDWVTPSLEQVGINGVMRSLMIEEIFPACDIPVGVSTITMDELTLCQSLMVCNSIKGLATVNTIYGPQNQCLNSLPTDQQTFMLCNTLFNMYPQYK
jgi:4-amino-4-deoxychorismate lyase